jgi:hypothetical protein
VVLLTKAASVQVILTGGKPTAFVAILDTKLANGGVIQKTTNTFLSEGFCKLSFYQRNKVWMTDELHFDL